MHDIGNYISEWNMLMNLADKLCSSFEVAQGEKLPSGTPFRLGAMLNVNANKFYRFVRQKQGLMFESMFEKRIMPDLLKDLRAKDILRITGDPEYVKRFYEMAINAWYIKNLIAIGPHTPEQAEMLKELKMRELRRKPDQIVKLAQNVWEGFKPRGRVMLTGENVNLQEDLETLYSFISLEADPIRRTALIEKAMIKKGFDVANLPKSTPEQLRPAPAAKAFMGEREDKLTKMATQPAKPGGAVQT